MPILTRIKPSEYHDSITLMLVREGAAGAAGRRGRGSYHGYAGQSGDHRGGRAARPIRPPAARPDDLLITVRASDEASGQAAMRQADHSYHSARRRPRSRRSAPNRWRRRSQATPDANLAVISVAGRYAATEARAALERGLHVLPLLRQRAVGG